MSRTRITEAVVAAVAGGADVVVTTGGTGLGPRDVTPQATAPLHRLRGAGSCRGDAAGGGRKHPDVGASREDSRSPRRARSMINVPGSVNGATESLDAVMPVLAHAIRLLHGDTSTGERMNLNSDLGEGAGERRGACSRASTARTSPARRTRVRVREHRHRVRAAASSGRGGRASGL